MRILLITQSYLPVLGGLQMVVHDLATGLIADGHTAQVVTQRYPRQLPARERIDSVPVRRLFFIKPEFQQLRQGRLDLFGFGVLTAPYTSGQLGRLWQDFRPDVVHVHYPHNLVPYVLSAYQRAPARLIVSFHGSEITEAQCGTPSERQRLVQLLEKADCVTAVSQNALNEVIVFCPSVQSKGRVVYNGLRETTFAAPAAYSYPRPYILGVGRLVKQKGFDLLIEAYSQLAANYPDIDLLIAGEGEDRPALEAQVQQAALGDRVRFLGKMSRPQIGALMQGCHFVVVPSRWEPFGLVALEAMALGRRVIATNVGGLPEFLGEEDNVVIDVSSTALRSSLNNWLADPNFGRDSAKNRERAAQFTVKRMIQNYETIYRA